MDARVKELIERQKEKYLLKLGLTKTMRRYVDEEEVKIHGLSNYTYDEIKKQFYVKEPQQVQLEPIEISDEDYEELCKYFPLESIISKSEKEPVKLGTLGIMGYIVLGLGLVGSLIMLCMGEFVSGLESALGVVIVASFMLSIDKILANIKAIKKHLERH